MENRRYLVSRYVGEDKEESIHVAIWKSYEAALAFVDDSPYYHITTLDYIGDKE